jgi:hypothetical protein
MGSFPEDKRFAFTIIDDTDVATVDNVLPMYRLLERLGMRTTKTVWPLACPDLQSNFVSSQTLEDPEYRDFVVDLQDRGFEIASHGASMESSERARTLEGLERMRATFGRYPAVHANHANNRENLYWGSARVDSPLLRVLYRLTLHVHDAYEGHVESSRYWWGDAARAHLRYVRNLTFADLDVSTVNPTMPYYDPRRPWVPWWFSAADAEDCAAFNRLLQTRAQDRLERRGGIAIVATHFGKGFVTDGRVNAETERLLEALTRRPGWFVPVRELLDWLRERRPGGALPTGEWRQMQWRWFGDLVRRGLADTVRRAVRSAASAAFRGRPTPPGSAVRLQGPGRSPP